MKYNIIYTQEANSQLLEIFNYIADLADLETAQNYTEKVLQESDSLSNFPVRGISRDDLMPGLRVTHYKRTAILFAIMNNNVVILGSYHGGRNYELKFIESKI